MSETKERISLAVSKARAELDEALYQLEKFPAASESSVSFAAHALNNFLTVVGGTIDLLQLSLAEHANPEVRTGLDTLQQATSLMTHTVSHLTISTRGGGQLRIEQVQLPVMVQRFVNYYQRMADRKAIRLVAGSAVDVPSVWTDRVTIAVVLDNLFSNAVKYSPSGKRIWAQVTADRDGVICSIRDEGPGLSEEDKARLFQRGVRLSPKPTGGEGSTGYGLAVAKEFIEKLGGTIGCESVLGQGACFSFYLPRRQEPVQGPEEHAPCAPSGTQEQS